MAEIRFSPDATDDLRQIKTYISEELYSEEAAVNTLSNIMKRIRILVLSFQNAAHRCLLS